MKSYLTIGHANSEQQGITETVTVSEISVSDADPPRRYFINN
jgi:hypothetical protein